MIGYFQVYLQTLITAGVTVEQYNTYITSDLQLTQYEQDDIISKSLLFLCQVRLTLISNFDFDYFKVYGV